MSSLDLESLAVRSAIKIEEFLRCCNIDSRSAKALSRRAEELPSLIQQAGLFQAIVFYLSKIEDELYSQVYDVIAADQQQSGRTKSVDCRSLVEEVTSEGGGYTVLLATLSYAISRYVSGVHGQSMVDHCSNLRSKVDVAKCLLNLREKGLLLSVERALTPFALTVKRLFEALF